MTNNKKAKIQKATTHTLFYVFTIVATLISIAPTFVSVLLSLMREKDIPLLADGGLKNGITFNNFIKVFSESAIPQWFLNSMFVAITQTVLYLFITSLAAFAFSRLKFKGRKVLFYICLSSMMVPGIINIVPNFLIITKLGLYNNLFAIILPGLSGVYGVFMLRQFMLGIPFDYDDAARIDGCSNLQIYFRVILPMCAPALAALAVFTFQGAWNDFLWPLIVTSEESTMTLSSGFYVFLQSNAQYPGLLMASAIVAALPIVIVFIFGQKYFLQGISTGGIKG